MLKYIYSIRYIVLLVAVSLTQYGCRKKIDFNAEDTLESGNLHPLQQFYAPWETISVTTKGTPYMIESNNGYLYIVSNDGSRRWVEYVTSNHNVTTLFYSQNYNFTALAKSGNSRMVLGASGGQSGVATFDHNGIINNYSFYVPSNRRINSIYDNGVRFYIGGYFFSFGTNPASDFADQIFWSSGTIFGCPGIVSEVYEMNKINFTPYACGNSILPTGHSIAEWTGTIWEPRTSIVNEKVTDLEQIGDTLFIAGFDTDEFAIKKFANGNLITDSTIVNTATSLSNSDVKMISHNNALYVYGTVNFPERFYTGILKYSNGEWSYLGKLGGIPADLAIFNGHLYALVGSSLKRFPL